MRRMMRETTVSLIPKEQIEYFKDDEKYIEFITNELTKKISERLIQVLESSDEIIVKKPVLKVSEYQSTTTNSVEYRKTVDWEPLVRCKDCKYATGWTTKYGLYGGLTCEQLDRDVDDKFYCCYGERKEERKEL